jgi:glycosyltransferase involved in cell wall biosynthesis
LQQNAYAYIHATEVGGTHPALIEAMGYGNCVLTYATPENTEVAGGAALEYRTESELTELIERVAGDRALVEEHRDRAQRRIAEHYSWDSITDRYEELFYRMTSGTK